MKTLRFLPLSIDERTVMDKLGLGHVCDLGTM